MRFRTIGLTSLITGLGQVNLLLGRVQRYWVGFGSATRCVPVNPLGRGAGRLVHAGCAHAVRLAGLHRIRPEADFQLRNSFFLFQICFVN
jgi:hypothetical protein